MDLVVLILLHADFRRATHEFENLGDIRPDCLHLLGGDRISHHLFRRLNVGRRLFSPGPRRTRFPVRSRLFRSGPWHTRFFLRRRPLLLMPALFFERDLHRRLLAAQTENPGGTGGDYADIQLFPRHIERRAGIADRLFNIRSLIFHLGRHRVTPPSQAILQQPGGFS